MKCSCRVGGSCTAALTLFLLLRGRNLEASSSSSSLEGYQTRPAPLSFICQAGIKAFSRHLYSRIFMSWHAQHSRITTTFLQCTKCSGCITSSSTKDNNILPYREQEQSLETLLEKQILKVFDHVWFIHRDHKPLFVPSSSLLFSIYFSLFTFVNQRATAGYISGKSS